MSDALRLQALFDFVINCLAQAEKLSQRETGRLLGASTGPEARKVYLALEGGKRKAVGELVPVLAGLRDQIYRRYLNGDAEINHPSRLISSEHIYLALQKLIALTPEEKALLGLPVDDCEVLLQQAFFNMSLYQRPWNEEGLLAIYRASTALQSSSESLVSQSSDQKDVDELIRQIAETYQREHLGYSSNANGSSLREGSQELKGAPSEKLRVVSKVKREINRILLKTGSSQLVLKGVDSREGYLKKYFPYSFIKRLTQSVIENELITEELPLFIDSVTVDKCGPFPLQVADTLDSKGLLSWQLLNFEGQPKNNEPDYSEMTSHRVHKITLQLYIRLNENEDKLLNALTVPQVVREGSRGKEIHFEVSSTGIGGTFSHIVKTLNQALLFDIKCLRQYLSIPHEIMMEQDIIGSGAPAPVVAHSLVKFCQVSTLGKAMQASQQSGELKSYERFAFDDPIGRGDFCGFDTLTSVATAALQARLKAIKFTGTAPQEYLNDLTWQIDKTFLLQKACSYLSGYPFSSLAKDSFLYLAFGNEWDRNLSIDDPLIYFKVQLELVESFLTEGLHDKALHHLNQLESGLEPVSKQDIAWYENFSEDINLGEDFRVFPSRLLARYEICKANYHYLTNSPEEAWQKLQLAEEHINIRLAKYSLIDEVSQAPFHPHYHLLTQIYFLRARLLLFFPFSSGGSRNKGLPTDIEHKNRLRSAKAVHVGRLYLFEKARLYSACDGDSELYACLTAYQSCVYLIISVLNTRAIKDFGPLDFSLTPNQARDWACRLRNEALLSYYEVGRNYYYQVKEKSGISEKRHHNFGEFTIDTVPAIREIRGDEEPGIVKFQPRDDRPPEKVLYLDMSMLGLDDHQVRNVKNDERGDTIYLFGTNACHLFFARGMFHLCSDYVNEFNNSETVNSLDGWKVKLTHAYRLFSYAWAIADDGVSVESNIADADSVRNVKRSFSVPEEVAEFEKDVASIRALYPHRITEIASLGRLYAATCATLLRYVVKSDNECQQYRTQLNWLLANLHSEDSFQQVGARDFIGNQERYNEHLAIHLARCHRHLKKEWRKASMSKLEDAASIKTYRRDLLRKLFDLEPRI